MMEITSGGFPVRQTLEYLRYGGITSFGDGEGANTEDCFSEHDLNRCIQH